MILKLDMMKAYERVSWQAQLRVLNKFGFGIKWVKWIKACISTARFSVILNGSPCGFFASSRGLRQGDPLSPFLFIILAEALSRAILRARESGTWKGIYIPHMAASHTYCLFADDTLLFGKATMGEAKSKLSRFWGFSVGQFPCKYLGILFFTGSKKHNFWECTSGAIYSRILSWSHKWLTFSGKIVLIRAVLNVIPIYLLSILKDPKKTVVALHSTLRSFIWNDNVNKKGGIPLLAWDRVCAPRDKGGARVKDLGLSWLIHNGHKARFWDEVWNGFPALSSLRDWSPLMSILKSSWGIFVADYFFVDSSSLLPVARWKSIDSLPMDQDIKSAFVDELKKHPLLFSEKDDELIWTYSKSGEYSVKEGYNDLSSDVKREDLPYKLFWHATCLPKVGAFAWLAVQDIILTGMRLDRLGCFLAEIPSRFLTICMDVLLDYTIIRALFDAYFHSYFYTADDLDSALSFYHFEFGNFEYGGFLTCSQLLSSGWHGELLSIIRHGLISNLYDDTLFALVALLDHVLPDCLVAAVNIFSSIHFLLDSMHAAMSSPTSVLPIQMVPPAVLIDVDTPPSSPPLESTSSWYLNS
ncbi:uncharacterized protein LOC131857532 [Cryptomeria japonica]|uniref:uncharacterized protein LOC131857532 n=1 Tax=Cryptomeria japonica TaxID=3369 RepID=UPI0027DA53B3|nr:uncharacterized protein LOC131857532 [Cryptomeria japonica]